MRLGLLGFPISHSLSPAIYKEILGKDITYDLLEYSDASKVPMMSELAKKYDGLNITTPYKTLLCKDVEYETEAFAELGFINALSFVDGAAIGTNTDYTAVETILQRYLKTYPNLRILLLGSGVMAKITEIIASSLEIPLQQFSRSQGIDLARLDLTKYCKQNTQTLVINACSRSFIFQGELQQDMLVWDYNYSYLSDPMIFSRRVKEYQDGQEMLRLQAQAAVEFWNRTNPKLKY